MGRLRVINSLLVSTVRDLFCVSWKRQASGPQWGILALKNTFCILFMCLLPAAPSPAVTISLCSRERVGWGLTRREKKKYKEPQHLFLPHPPPATSSFSSVPKQSEAACIIVETPPHSCSTGPHPWLWLLLPLLQLPDSVRKEEGKWLQVGQSFVVEGIRISGNCQHNKPQFSSFSRNIYSA